MKQKQSGSKLLSTASSLAVDVDFGDVQESSARSTRKFTLLSSLPAIPRSD